MNAVICPICLASDVYASHRRGRFERGPLTWIGFLPFRCAQCQRRFFHFAPKDPRRHHRDDSGPREWERPRPPRWSARGRVTLSLCGPGEAGVVVQGNIENASLEGMRVRLPVALEEGSQVLLTPEGEAAQRGTVRWRRPREDTGILHGIQFEMPVRQQPGCARSLRQARMRQAFRRGLMFLIGVMCMALAAYTIVWLVEALRLYAPQYYEPKDIERYLYQRH